MKKIFKVVIITTFLISLFISFFPKKVNAVTFPYSDAVVDNLASVIASEMGCGNKDEFVYEMIWAAVFTNNYNYYFENRKTPSTVVYTQDNMCNMFKHKLVYSSGYCYFSFSKGRATQCSQSDRERLRLAARMVLAKSFTIPGNVYLAAENSVLNNNGYAWVSFRPAAGGELVNFGYQKTEKLSTKDIYGNTVRTDEQFYHDLANCLYDHPTLYYAYNKCSTTPTTYKVYLYPNGGTGIKDKYELEYTNRKAFTDFPNVTKSNCILDGWNRDSVNGTQYKTDVGPEDNGKSFYARWICQEPSSNSSSSKSSSSSSSSSNSKQKITVTFKMNNGTNTIFWSEIINTNELATEPKNNPTRDGYTFDGWITEDNQKFDFKTKLTEDLSLYAKWIKESKQTSSQNIPSSTINQNSKTTNPQTGMFGLIIFVILMIPTSLAAFAYYQNYISNSKNQ